jgi:hypothetical protein
VTRPIGFLSGQLLLRNPALGGGFSDYFLEREYCGPEGASIFFFFELLDGSDVGFMVERGSDNRDELLTE